MTKRATFSEAEERETRDHHALAKADALLVLFRGGEDDCPGDGRACVIVGAEPRRRCETSMCGPQRGKTP